MSDKLPPAAEYWGTTGEDKPAAAIPSADEFWGPTEKPKEPKKGLADKAVELATTPAADPNQRPAGERRGGTRREAGKPYVAGDERVPAPTGLVLDKPPKEQPAGQPLIEKRGAFVTEETFSAVKRAVGAMPTTEAARPFSDDALKSAKELLAGMGPEQRASQLSRTDLPKWMRSAMQAAAREIELDDQAYQRTGVAGPEASAQTRADLMMRQGLNPGDAGRQGQFDAQRGGVPQPLAQATSTPNPAGITLEQEAAAKAEGQAVQRQSIGARGAFQAGQGLRQAYSGAMAMALRVAGDEDGAKLYEAEGATNKIASDAAAELMTMRERAGEAGIVNTGLADYFERQATGGAGSAVQNLPGMAAGVVATLATGNPLLGTRVAMSLMSGQVFGQEYINGRTKGLSPGHAAGRSGAMAALEYLGERYGLVPQAMNALRGKAATVPLEDLPQWAERAVKAMEKRKLFTSPVASAAVRGQVGEQIGEQLTGAGQYLLDGTKLGLNQDISVAGFLENARDTAVQTMIATGALQLAGGAANVALGSKEASGAQRAGAAAETARQNALAKWSEAFGPKPAAAPRADPTMPPAPAAAGMIAPIVSPPPADPNTTAAGSTTSPPPAPQAPPNAPIDAGSLLGTPLDEEAHGAATSPTNDRPEPTQAQKEAGNYKLGHIKLGGLDVSVENPQGSVRRGVDEDGKAWENQLQHHYGYIRGTEGADGDHVDAFIRPGTPEDYAGPVFIVDQRNPRTGKFDEHKVLLGFDSPEEAEAAYRGNYAPDWDGLGYLTGLDMPAFKDWVRGGNHKQPFSAGFKETRGVDKHDVAAPAPVAAAAGDGRGAEPGGSIGNLGQLPGANGGVGGTAAAPVPGSGAPGPVGNASAADPALSGTPDFETSYPSPLGGPNSQFSGMEDAPAFLAKAVRGVHQEVSNGIRTNATTAKMLADAMRKGVDPATGGVQTGERLSQLAGEHLDAVEGIDRLLQEYEGEFGPDARAAFQASIVPDLEELRRPFVPPPAVPAPAPAPAEPLTEAQKKRQDVLKRVGKVVGVENKAGAPVEADSGSAAPAPVAPAPSGVERGQVGGKLSSGQVVLTASGRKTTPFPKVAVDTGRKATNTVKAVDSWLMQNALAEAEARGDDFNATQFRASLEKPQQADKDAAEEYLFGQQPDVAPSILKPLAGAPGNTVVEHDGKFFVRLGDDRALVGPIKTRAEAEQYAVTAGQGAPVPPSWASSEFSPRIEKALADMEALGEQGVEMARVTRLGLEGAVKQGRPIDEARTAFTEELARKTAGRLNRQPTTWEPMTLAQLQEQDGVVSALPEAIQQAALDKLNAIGPELAAQGAKHWHEVTADWPAAALAVKMRMQDVMHALMHLAPARYAVAIDDKRRTPRKIEDAEDFATEILGIDTRAIPGIDVARQITAGGAKERKKAKTTNVQLWPRTVGGSELLAMINQIGGINPDLMSEIGVRVQSGLRDRNGFPRMVWHNPDGGKMAGSRGERGLFRPGGKGIDDITAAMEEAGYLVPGSLEADYKGAQEAAREMITAALNKSEPKPIMGAETRLEQEKEQAYRDFKDAEEADRAEELRLFLLGEIGLGEASIAELPDDSLMVDNPLWDHPENVTTEDILWAAGWTDTEIGEFLELQERLDDARQDADEEGAPGPRSPEAGRDGAGEAGAAAAPGESAPRPADRQDEAEADTVVNGRPRAPDVPREECLLLMPCSGKKLGHRALATELYQGPMWQTLRTRLAGAPMPPMRIVSAKHGILRTGEMVEPYDQVLTPEQADKLAGLVQYGGLVIEGPIRDVQIVGGRLYRQVMRAAVAAGIKDGTIAADASIREITGEIGMQRQQLGAYVEGLPPARDGGQAELAQGPAPAGPRSGSDVRSDIDRLRARAGDAARARIEGQENIRGDRAWRNFLDDSYDGKARFDAAMREELTKRKGQLDKLQRELAYIARAKPEERAYQADLAVIDRADQIVKGLSSDMARTVAAFLRIDTGFKRQAPELRTAMLLRPAEDVIAAFERAEAILARGDNSEQARARRFITSVVPRLYDNQVRAAAKVLSIPTQDLRDTRLAMMTAADPVAVQGAISKAGDPPGGGVGPIVIPAGQPAPDFELEAPTIEQLQADADRIAAQARADAEEQRLLVDKAKADAARNEFVLTGSDRPADVAAAAGQTSIFDAPAEPVSQQPPARDENAIALRKRLSVLKSLRECLG